MKTDLIHTLAIIFAAGIVLVGILGVLEPQSSSEQRVLSVSGDAVRSVQPDEATVTFSVITEHENANTARTQNAALAEQVVSALAEYGTVETSSFFVTPIYEPWRNDNRDPRIQLYRVTNSVTVTMTDLERVGNAIDAGTTAGANQVQNVQFSLTDATRDAIRTELLAEAARQAREKADHLAAGLDVRIRGVHSVSESSVSFPGPYFARMESVAMDSAAPSTPIEARDLDVRASVSVQFALR